MQGLGFGVFERVHLWSDLIWREMAACIWHKIAAVSGKKSCDLAGIVALAMSVCLNAIEFQGISSGLEEFLQMKIDPDP